MARFRAVVVLCIAVLMALAIGVHVVSASAEEVIYRPGDWVRYRYSVRTSEETCVWIIKVTIREVNATHVRYDAGLESMVSGGKLCESLTSLLVIGLGFESATPVDLRTTTPESKRFLVSPNYTGTYTFGNATVRYYRGVLVWYHENITTPFVGTAEAVIIDTSISDLKQFITVTIPTPPQTPTPATITVTATTTLTQIITTAIPTTLTTTIRVYETVTATSIATVTTEKTVEKTATLTVTTSTTVYERVVDWGTTITVAIILLVIGIAIGYLIKRK
jgi:large-conductance mechanosensitive channel